MATAAPVATEDYGNFNDVPEDYGKFTNTGKQDYGRFSDVVPEVAGESTRALDETESAFGPNRVEAARIAVATNKENLRDFTPFVELPRAGQQEGVAKEIAAGVYNTAANIIEPLESPAGINAAGLSMIPGAGRAIAGGFGIEMLKDVPDAVRAFRDAEGVQQTTEAVGRIVTDVVAGGLGVGGAVYPGKIIAKEPKLGEPNAVQIGSATEEVPRSAEGGQAESVGSGGMGQEQQGIAPAGSQTESPPATTETAAAGEVIQTSRGQIKILNVPAQELLHGTDAAPESIRLTGIQKGSTKGLVSEGAAFLTPDKDTAKFYGKNQVPVSVPEMRLADLRDDPDFLSKADSEFLKSNGFDGWIAQGGKEIAVFDTSKIKLTPAQPPPETPVTGLAEGGTGLPVEPETTGVANRVLEAEAKIGKIDEIAHGEGMSWQEMVDLGREQLNKGADPQEIARRFNRTKRISPSDFAVLRAERERLAVESNQAAQAVRENPTDSVAQEKLKQARTTETSWIQDVVQPAKTSTSDIFRGMQGEAPIDTTTFEGLRRAVLDAKSREPTAKEAVKLEKRAASVRKAKMVESSATRKLGEEIDRALPKTRVPTLSELRAEITRMAEELAPCK